MEMTSGSSYTYKHLKPECPDPIRLLRLLKAPNFADEIRCDIWETALHVHPSYEALSYTWGKDSSQSMPAITLNDDGKEHSFSITQNLEQAFRYLRLANQDRVLWNDAICINQEDKKEKSKQIAQMRLIYTQAKRVVVWLGEEGSAKIALAHLSRLDRAFEADTRLRTTTYAGMSPAEAMEVAANSFPKRHKYFRKPILEAWYHSEWAACEDLLNRLWWNRSWTLQEVIHAGDVLAYIGRIEIPLDELCEKMIRLQEHKSSRDRYLFQYPPNRPLDAPVPTVTPARVNFGTWIRSVNNLGMAADTISSFRQQAIATVLDLNSQAWRPKLGPLLMGVRNQEAKEKQDKIWAFVGMAQQDYDLDAARDYAKLSWVQLYTRVAHFMLAKSLLTLLWVESPERDMSDQALPSWVTDHSQRQTLISRAMVSTWGKFDADRYFPPMEKEPRHILSGPLEDTVKLVLRGIEVGTVMDTKTTTMSDDSEFENNGTKLKLFKYRKWQDLSEAPDVNSPSEAGYFESSWSNASHRNTSWAPLNTEKGDVIIISPGSRIPLVLRKFEEGYKFVGGCWLVDGELQDLNNLAGDPGFSGIMFGSVCANACCAAQVQEFVIC